MHYSLKFGMIILDFLEIFYWIFEMGILEGGLKDAETRGRGSKNGAGFNRMTSGHSLEKYCFWWWK